MTSHLILSLTFTPKCAAGRRRWSTWVVVGEECEVGWGMGGEGWEVAGAGGHVARGVV